MDLHSTRIDADSTSPHRAVNELTRLAHRRAAQGLPDIQDKPQGVADGITALALSGGGIRSATLSFGVMQALATCVKPAGAPVPVAAPPVEKPPPLLAMFDYLSTVSGGGYIGAFFCSLFVPKRLRPNSNAKQAAVDAYETCAYIPPERLRAEDSLDVDAIGKLPTAWLRENGRYLTPTGAGDGLYAAATALRNWLAIHYVLGTLFIWAFSALALTRAALEYYLPWYGANVEKAALHEGWDSGGLWWSPVWGIAAAIVVFWMAPCGIAYWLAYPARSQSETDKPSLLGAPAWAGIGVGVLLFAPFAVATQIDGQNQWAAVYMLPAFTGGASLVAFVIYAVCAARCASIADLRVKLTRVAARGIGWALGFAMLAITDTAGQSLYLMLSRPSHGLKPLTPAVVLAAVVWIIRRLAAFTDETSNSTSFLKKLPLDLISAVAGGSMLLIVGCLWSALVQFFSWQGAPPTSAQLSLSNHVLILTALFVISFVMAWTAGQFPGFINLSTLQSVYGARLTRAYLGASNGARFSKGSQAAPRRAGEQTATMRRAATREAAPRSVAEPLPSDQISLATYYDAHVLAPLHIINATVNQTVDPAEQLVQRDRKGRPLAILPNGFTIDGAAFKFDAKLTQNLSIGQWIGISGAAFTTGLGRATSVGTSLALGLANVRLGLWWTSGYGRDISTGLEHWFKKVFRVQTFLLYELLARFHGLSREWQYLSDGGHFENTGAYELLRPSRGVRFIVICDNGCDPEYRFGDVANLIRLARIDYQLDIEVDQNVCGHETLGKVFGRLGDFKPGDTCTDKCAILLNVFSDAKTAVDRKPVARIVVLKPKVIDASSIDICQYHATHPDFPQQTTANQFFDEAQWESYRDLGYRIGKRIFGRPDEGGCGPALWAYLTPPVADQGSSTSRGK